MSKEVLDFYAENKIPLDRLLSVARRKGLEEGAVVKAAEAVYDRVKSGEKIESIRLAWEVFRHSGPARERTWPAEKGILSEIRALKEIVIAQKADKDKVVYTVQDSVGQLNKVINARFNSIPRIDNKNDIVALQGAVEKLNRDLVELNTPWYKKVLRWFNGN